MPVNGPSGLIQKCLKLLAPNEPLVIGFSGGSDSLALLTYLIEIGDKSGRDVHALIVNHKIKPEADAQATTALEQALSLGAKTQVLSWQEETLVGHAKARNARYQLLADAIKQLGAAHLWLAHTADDQVETFFLRMSAGSGLRGLAVMGFDAPYPIWPQGAGLRVLRPLLECRRKCLQNDLQNIGLNWLEDAANHDRRYARVRLRQQLTDLQEAGFDFNKTQNCIAPFQQIATIEQNFVQELLQTSVVFSSFGFAEIKVDLLANISPSVLARLLEKVMLGVSGNLRCKHVGEKLVQIWNSLQRSSQPVTLNGCLLKYKNDNVQVFRDPGAVLRRTNKLHNRQIVLPANKTIVFDQRWQITLPQRGLILPLGNNQKNQTSQQRHFIAKIPFYARTTLPILQLETGKSFLLPMDYPEQICFIGAARGMETGTRFA